MFFRDSIMLICFFFNFFFFFSGKKTSGVRTLYISPIPDSVFIKSPIGVRLLPTILLLFGNKKLKPLTTGPMLLKYVSGKGQSTSDVSKEVTLSWAGSF